MAAAAVEPMAVTAEPPKAVTAEEIHSTLTEEITKRAKVVPKTYDELLDMEESLSQDASRARIHIPPRVLLAMLEGRVLFKKAVLNLPRIEAEQTAKEQASVPAAKPASEEDKEKIRLMLQDRDQRMSHRVDVDQSQLALKDYRRELPPFCALQGKEILVIRSLVQVDDHRRLTDAGMALMGKNQYAQKLCKMIEHDAYVSSVQFTRGEVLPALIETPVLYALMQRPASDIDRWTVPAVIDTLSLLRYYRAVSNLLRYLLFAQNRDYYLTHVEKCYAQVEAYANEIHELRWNSRRRVADKLREEGAPVDSLSELSPEELLTLCQKHKDTLQIYERATRQLMIDFLQAYEALISQLFAVGPHFCEMLYSSGSVPPTALCSEHAAAIVATASRDLWKLAIQVRATPLEGTTADSALSIAHQQMAEYLRGVTKPTNDFLFATAGDDDGQMRKNHLLSVDGAVSRLWFWVSAVYWAAHSRLIPRGAAQHLAGAPPPTNNKQQ